LQIADNNDKIEDLKAKMKGLSLMEKDKIQDQIDVLNAQNRINEAYVGRQTQVAETEQKQASTQQTPEATPAEEKEEKELDDKGIPFVKASDGTTVFGEICDEQAQAMGTGARASIKLSEGNAKYGEDHINHRLAQLQQNGYENVSSFVEDLAKNYDEIREGNLYVDKNGNEKETFLLVKIGEKGSVLFVELSPNKGYYDVNSGGVFNNKYINKKELLWSGGTHHTQLSGETADVSIGQSKINPSESPGAPLSQSNSLSEDKDTAKNPDMGKNKGNKGESVPSNETVVETQGEKTKAIRKIEKERKVRRQQSLMFLSILKGQYLT
jgi:hypothetical protein